MDNASATAADSTLCRAGFDHAALKADRAAFAALDPIGAMPSYADDGEPDGLILSNCACGSTLCLPVDRTSTEYLEAYAIGELKKLIRANRQRAQVAA